MTPPRPRLLDIPVVEPVEEASLEPAMPDPGALVRAVKEEPDALVYFLLNVADGDTQLFLLPAGDDGHRRLVVVDVATKRKLPGLLAALHAQGIIGPPRTPGQLRLLVATHPHHDHIGGIVDLLGPYPENRGFVDQFWEPGFFYPSPSFHSLMLRMEQDRDIHWLQPTSGTSLFLDRVRFTVVGPGVALRNRFDTYGVNVNDASITLMVEYPATKVLAERDPDHAGRVNRRLVRTRTRRMLLGADAQFKSWAQATVDFPNLEQEYNPVLARELRGATGRDYLRADILKVSHHGSKHGVNIELLERVAASATLVSSQVGAGNYNFPHLLAMEAVREARQATTTSRAERWPDQRLGIHITGGSLQDGTPLGSIAVLLSRSGAKPVRLFRLFDPPTGDVVLEKARQSRQLRS